MKSASRDKEAQGLTRQSLATLLAVLDADRERAGERYEQLRQKLVALFKWRGSIAPDELADETLNRLARKLYEGEAIRDLSGYAGGIARLVWLETLKRQEREQAALEELGAARHRPELTEALRVECFESCLESLSPETRMFILDYYSGEKRAKIEARKKLAEEKGMPLTTLRNRAHRIRAQLQACVADCLKKSE